MNLSLIPASFLKQIYHQAEREYPFECCGLMTGAQGIPGILTRLIPCQNVQNEYHQRDAQSFPRTSENAYMIDPNQLLSLQKNSRLLAEEIQIIYHSHPDAPAMLSQEDLRLALDRDGPLYPNVRYLVVSVIKGKVCDANLFHWDKNLRAYRT